MVFLNLNDGEHNRRQLKNTKSLSYHLSCPNITEASTTDVINVGDDITNGSFCNQG